MDSFTAVSQRENVCPLFCIFRTVLFITIIAFLLYLPLGDPRVHCESVASTHNRRIAMCYLCESYFIIEQAVRNTLEILKFVTRLTEDFLHEAKLKFYALLEKIDREDLCNSVCCKADDEPREIIKETTITCPKCKCIRNRCRRNRDCLHVKQ